MNMRAMSKEHFFRWARRNATEGRAFRDAVIAGRVEVPQRLTAWAALTPSRQRGLHCLNAYARTRLSRLVAAGLGAKLGAEAPSWIPTKPVHMVTISVRAHRHLLSEFEPDTQLRFVGRVRDDVEKWMLGLDYLGMVDVAFIASCGRYYEDNYAISLHGHLIVWDASRSKLDRCLENIRRMPGSVAGIKPLKIKRWKPADYRQLVWYIFKQPRRQYQLIGRRDKTFDAPKRRFDGTNRVRLYNALSELRLPQLVMSGGTGVAVQRRVMAAIRRWQARPQT